MKVFLSDFELMSSLGNTQDSFWDSLVTGKSGVYNISDRVSAEFPVKQAAIIKSEPIFPDCKELLLRSEVEISFKYMLDRLTHRKFNNLEVDSLLWSSGQFGRKVTDFSANVKESFTETETFEENINRILQEKEIHLNKQNSIIGLANACVSGASAIEIAFNRIKMGVWTRVLVFIHEARSREWVLSPYLEMGLLSRRIVNGKQVSSPFSRDRSGFIKGEGSVLLLIESEDSANSRNIQPWVEILGCAQSSEGENLIKMSEVKSSSAGMLESLFYKSKVKRNQINYINGYGSASQLNDLLETKVYKDFFGRQAYEIPISVGKPQFGHLNTGAVGLELVSTVLMMKKGKICPTINFGEPDKDCDLDYVPNNARDAKIRIALKMGFGFGWSNAGILIKSID